MSGPIRYVGDKGMSPFWQWFDQTVGWEDMILGLCIIILICLVIDIKNKGEL